VCADGSSENVIWNQHSTILSPMDCKLPHSLRIGL
jgi:hypothetical protein